MGQDQPKHEAGPLSDVQPKPPPVVAFDFDGTLTVRDSFIAFMKENYTTDILLGASLRAAG